MTDHPTFARGARDVTVLRCGDIHRPQAEPRDMTC
jgi:hypothetical protein